MIRWRETPDGEWNDLPDGSEVEFELFSDFASCSIHNGHLVVTFKFERPVIRSMTGKTVRIESRD